MSESRELRVNGAHLSLLSHKCRLCLLKGPVHPKIPREHIGKNILSHLSRIEAKHAVMFCFYMN